VRQRSRSLVALGCVTALIAGTAACNRGTGEPVVGLITKTDTNPFFVTMKEGAQGSAGAAGVDLQTFAGRVS
jgi:fructose transport system substrate-binding protein